MCSPDTDRAFGQLIMAAMLSKEKVPLSRMSAVSTGRSKDLPIVFSARWVWTDDLAPLGSGQCCHCSLKAVTWGRNHECKMG